MTSSGLSGAVASIAANIALGVWLLFTDYAYLATISFSLALVVSYALLTYHRRWRQLRAMQALELGLYDRPRNVHVLHKASENGQPSA